MKTSNPFLVWYAAAESGAVNVYATGHTVLVLEDEKFVKTPAAQSAWDYALAGKVTLTQKRIGPGVVAYCATKCDWAGLPRSFPLPEEVENIGIQRKDSAPKIRAVRQ